ncbi:MAG: hypothetical protein EU529_13015 [Promethearchaeota archaeon]|nr:MAG: hypothetical protein EU529_13015 [Candidatus Lokiarchaeota archaeon]
MKMKIRNMYLNKEQKKATQNSRKRLELSKKYSNPIVTKIVPASEFWHAEEYHQQYLEKNRGRFTPSCNFI